MKAKYAALATSLFLYSSTSVATDKMTYAEAVQNHKAAFGQFNGRTQSELQALWATYVKTPESAVVDSGGKIEVVWQGRSKSVDLPSGPGFYFITTEDSSQTLRSGWINITSTGRKAELGMLDYGGNAYFRWVGFQSGKFTTYSGSSQGESWIVSVAKGPTEPVATECTPGQTQTTALACSSSQSWNWGCSMDGEQTKTCGTAGFWGNPVVTRPAECVPANQHCP